MSACAPSTTTDSAPSFEAGIFETPGPGFEPFLKIMHGLSHEQEQEEIGENGETIAACNDCGVQKKIESMQKFGNASAGRGRGKKVSYRCNTCNACRSRLNRLMGRRGDLAVDWSGLGEDEKRDFFARCNQLEKDELQAGLISTVELHKELKSTTRSAHEGSYYPLSVYAAKGYNEQHLKAIEQGAPKKFDGEINDWVYQKFIDSSGVADSSSTTNLQVSAPKSQPSAKRARVEGDGTDPKRVKAEEKKEALAKKSEEKKIELEMRKKVADEKRLAARITSMLAPCITCGADLIRHKAPRVTGRVPETYVQDAKCQLNNLEMADIAWKEVLKGGPAPTDPSWQLKDMQEAVKKANKTFTNVGTLIKIAETA